MSMAALCKALLAPNTDVEATVARPPQLWRSAPQQRRPRRLPGDLADHNAGRLGGVGSRRCLNHNGTLLNNNNIIDEKR
jgi:hypothetical protein